MLEKVLDQRYLSQQLQFDMKRSKIGYSKSYLKYGTLQGRVGVYIHIIKYNPKNINITSLAILILPVFSIIL